MSIATSHGRGEVKLIKISIIHPLTEEQLRGFVSFGRRNDVTILIQENANVK